MYHQVLERNRFLECIWVLRQPCEHLQFSNIYAKGGINLENAVPNRSL